MSLTAFESWGEQESPVISVGMKVSERDYEERYKEGPPLHLFIDGQDVGIFDWELINKRTGSVDYLESEAELKAKQLMPAVEWVIANCMHGIYEELDTVEFPDEDIPLAA